MKKCLERFILKYLKIQTTKIKLKQLHIHQPLHCPRNVLLLSNIVQIFVMLSHSRCFPTVITHLNLLFRWTRSSDHKPETKTTSTIDYFCWLTVNQETGSSLYQCKVTLSIMLLKKHVTNNALHTVFGDAEDHDEFSCRYLSFQSLTFAKPTSG